MLFILMADTHPLKQNAATSDRDNVITGEFNRQELRKKPPFCF